MIKSQVRLADEVWAWVRREGERNDRSINAQIQWSLKQQMAIDAATNSEETGASVSQTSAPASRITSEGPK